MNLQIDRFRLADWVVAPDENALRRGSEVQRLEPRAMDVLVRLCLGAGETVAAEALLRDVWHGTFYGDNPVHKAVAQIRRALGDSARTPRYIETVRSRGYRVCIPVLIESPASNRSGQATASWACGSPFRGLEPFGLEHESVYFGRSEAVSRVLSALRQQCDASSSLVLVVGHSGSGKTSLLQAGVAPALLRGCDGVQALGWARCDPASESPDGPLATIAQALMNWSIQGRPVFLPSEHDEVTAQLAEAPQELGRRIDVALARAQATGATRQESPRLLLVVDPLEAVLDGAQASASASRIDAALHMLGTHPGVVVLLACRADFYPKLLDSLPAVMRLKGGTGHVDLPPLGVPELVQCVREPARAAALQFGREPGNGERLDDRLIEDAQRSPEMLPMLQHVLALLYEQRDARGELSFAVYREMGGLEGAIATHAERAVANLDVPARDALDAVLAAVATVSVESGSVLLHRSPLSALSSPSAVRLVQALVDARLFVSDLSAGQPYFGVAHEALLRHWPRASAWVQRNRRWLQLHARVKLAARRWQDEDRRGDLLLRSRRLVLEARELGTKGPVRLSPTETDFVAASMAHVRKSRGLVAATGALLLALALTTGVLATRAEMARAEAELRREQADALLDFTLGGLADQLRPLGRLDVLEGVAIQVLDTLPQEATGVDSEEALRRARALRTLAEVLVAQGKLDEGTRAIEEARKRLADRPPSPDVTFELSQLDYWEGLVAYREQRLEAARLHWASYADHARRLRILEPDNADWILEESYARNNLGVLATRQGAHPEAADAFRVSLGLKRSYLELEPESASVQAELADSLSWLADALDRSGRLREAAPLMHEQESILQRAQADAPRDSHVAHQHALAQVRAGLLDLALGRQEAAMPRIIAGHAGLLELSRQDPSNRTWARDAAYVRAQLGWLMATTGAPTVGLAHLQGAKAQLEPLVVEDDAPREWQRLHAMTALRAAIVAAPGVPATATDAAVGTAVARLEGLAGAGDGGFDARAALAEGHLVRGDWRFSRGDAEGAQASWHQARLALLDIARLDAPDRVLFEPLVRALQRLRDPDLEQWRDALRGTGHAHPGYIADAVPHYFQGVD